ncbi:MAG TPA: hypothetical protein VMR18_00410 [Candidatus Saccharimonadales bacterium]|nr:hypothetical protein [Candidatus Saccharimonadales bacterium]
MKKLGLSLLLASLAISVLPAHVLAAKVSVNGLTLTPAIEQISLLKGQASASFSATVTNNTKNPEVITISTTDFTALNNTGGVEFLRSSTQPNNSHGLAEWLKPGVTQFALSAGGIQTIPISIANVTSLAPGGHYGAVVFKVVPTIASSKKNQISSNEDISMLVFLTTYGGGIQSVKLDNPPINSFTLHMPSSVDLVFTNNGNTQTAPVGLVTVTNSSNHEIARGIINIDSGLVLPATSGLFIVKLNYEHNFNLPGNYHINIIYQADSSAIVTTYVKKFVFIDEQIVILIIVGLLALAIFVIRKLNPIPVTKEHRTIKIKIT